MIKYYIIHKKNRTQMDAVFLFRCYSFELHTKTLLQDSQTIA